MSQGRFTPVPAVPVTGVEEWRTQFYNALRQDVNLLIGAGAEQDGASMAIVRGMLARLPPVPEPSIARVTPPGPGVSISGANIALTNDVAQLAQDVQLLANDVVALRQVVVNLLLLLGRSQ